MASSQLTVFVSSKMDELAPERLAIKAALEELEINGWVFEKDAGARAQSIQQTYLEEVEKADLYIGLFWKGYGDYTIEEFDYARSLHKDCLLYEKRKDIDGSRDERLAQWLAKLGDVETGLTSKWFNTPAELKEFVKRDVARWQAEIVRRYKVAGAPRVYQPLPPAEDRTRRDLLTLIDKVEQFWIKGVLEQSVHHQFFIELGKEKMDEAITHPWETVLELPNQAEATIPTDRKITDVFEDVGRYLLILGKPGSGKTITLLQLARDLIAQARTDPAQPIPTVFNLSSWAGKEEPIADWMARELSEKYQVPKKIGKVWLDQHLLLPLLDGLDEVTPDLQDDCVRAINDFVKNYPSGLVVCSRLQEYMSLPTRLRLGGAICLQPLSLQQVKNYLEKAGPSLNALKHALTTDSTLRDLIQTPLMLSVVSLAYEHAPMLSLENKSGKTVETLRAEVFDAYIERMVQRKGTSGRVYSKETLNGWLGWLARQMKSHSQTIFLIEQLQADWLGTRWQRLLYILISRLLGGLFIGAGLGLAGGIIHYNNYASMKSALLIWAVGMVCGLLLGIVAAVITCVKEFLIQKISFIGRATGFRRSFVDIAIYAVTWLLVFGTAIGVLFRNDPSGFAEQTIFMTIAYALTIGILHWTLFGDRSPGNQKAVDITTIETLKWSWRSALKSGRKAAVIVAIIILPVAVFSVRQKLNLNAFHIANNEKELHSVETELSSLTAASGERWVDLSVRRDQLQYRIEADKSDSTYFSVITFVALGTMIAGVFGGVIGIIFGGFKEGISDRKTRPNQGVKLTIRNATIVGVTMGLLASLVITLICILVDYSFWTDTTSLKKILFMTELSLIIGLPLAFRNGIYDAIKHYTLRAILVSGNYIPRHYVKVLNYAVALILLQRVGGGYIFIHRTLLEHYAAMYDT